MPGSSEVTDLERQLLEIAADYRDRAHAPITGYKVGAALLGADERAYGGCNVEHIILSLSCCAEQVAVHTGVAEGCPRFTTVAVVTESSPPAAPCGSCRQMLHAWGVERVVMGNTQGEVWATTLAELLPHAFDLKAPRSV